MAEQVERIVAVDWSGDKGPGQKKKIWAAVWFAGTGRVTLESGRTRDQLCDWLVELARETPRMVVGMDLCFSYPAWLLAEMRCQTVFAFWQRVAEGQGEQWLSRECSDERFWGVPGPRRSGRRPAEFCGEGLRRMMRTTDWANKIAPRASFEQRAATAAVAVRTKKAHLSESDAESQAESASDAVLRAAMAGITAKSPFQIGGSGSVGTGSLRGMASLARMRAAGFCVWPFEDAALVEDAPSPLVVEMYTRLLTGAVKKSNPIARKAYLAERCKGDSGYAALSRGVIEKAAGSEDAFDALVCALEMVRSRQEFLRLRRTEDPILRLEGITWRPGLAGPA